MSSSSLVFEEFEPRILYSADFAPLVLAGLADHQLLAQSANATEAERIEIAFVDLSLPDAQALIDDLQAQAHAGRTIEVVGLEAGEDGITQIGAALDGRSGISAVHVVSHGADAVVQLGSARLDGATLLARAAEVARWSQALTGDADLLLYGCDVAATAQGQQLITALAALTGADVAASSDATGSAGRSGNWQLELASGSVEAGVAVTQAFQQSWGGLLLAATNEIPVNTTTLADQTTSAENRGSQQAVALDAAGNYVVVWASNGQDGSAYGVYARRFDATGAALTGEILVNSTTNNDQTWARVASDAAGNFVVTWTSENQDGTASSVYARRFDANGNALTAEARVNTTATGAQTDPVIGMNASNGDYVIAWQGEGPGDTAGIFFRRFFADGTAKDAVDRLANLTSAGTENDPAVTMAPNGNFVIAWEAGNKVYFQRFDALGGALNGNVQIDNFLSTSSAITIASDAAGNFTVVYREANILPGVWGKGFNADGSVKYTWFQLDSGDANNPSIDMAADGAFVVTYEKSGDGSGTGVYARKYNADGSAAGVAFQVSQTTTGPQANASVAVVGDRSFVVAWSGTGPGDSNGVFARQFGPFVQISAAQDTYIDSGNSSNFGTSASLVVDRTGGNLGNGRALLQFDLSALPAGATITGATLELQATANASPFMVDVYRLTEAWVEGNGGTSAANWNDRLTGTAWTNINGASVDPTPAATWASLPPAGAGLHSWDLTNLVRAWQTDGSSNHGILLGSAETGTTAVTYGSSESLTPPRLVVTYTLETAPVNTVPGAQSTDEDTAMVFSAANGNPISIADANAGGANNQVTLSVTNGSLTLAGIAGLTFVAGDGMADASMTLRGTASAINTALNGLSYLPTSNYNGSATLTLATKDSDLLSLDLDTGLLGRYAFENSGALGTDTSPAAGYTGTVSGATAVSDPTRGNVLGLAGAGYVQTTGSYGNPANVTLAAWVNLTTADSGGADVITLGNGVVLRLDQPNGTMAGSFYDGSGWIVTPYTTTLAGTGWHHVAYTVNDTGNAATLYLDGVAVDLTSTTQSINYTLGADSFIGKHGNGSTTRDFNGSIDDARIYNRALTASEIATLAADLSRTDTDTVAITVSPMNDAPTATNLSAAETYTEDALRNLSNIVVSDVDSASVTATLSLSNVAAGSLSTGTSGAVTSTFVAGVWAASGAIADVNTLLAGLSFTPSANFNANFTIATGVSDDAGAAVSGSMAMTGTAVNDAPAITSNGGGASAAINVAENATVVITVTATDADLPAQTLSYSIAGGADAARFTINTTTGTLAFIAPPNYEVPTDTGANNVYDVIVQASDGTLADTQAIAVTVTPVNDNTPVITSNGGGATATINVAENAGAVTIVTATDTDLPAPTLTYSISGGADAARFSINTTTGALSFIFAPNYEVPTDLGANNAYDVTVQADDGTLTDTQAIVVTVSDANEFPVGAITDANAAGNSVAESAGVGALAGVTAIAVDADATNNMISYTLDNSAGGRFGIDSTTGVLSVAGVLDYEISTSHAVTVRATSADGSFATALITIGVTGVSEAAVGAISDVNAAANQVVENAATGTLVGIVASAFDSDVLDVVTYSLIDNAGGRFAINSTTGVVVVASALDAETAPSHAIVVRADSTDGSFNTQAFTVTVADVNEFVITTVSDTDAAADAIDENVAIGSLVGISASAVDADATNNTASYSLDDSAGGRFAIDATSGVVTVASAIDREVAPGHVIVVRATSADGSSSTRNFAIAINPVNDNAPDIVSDGGAGTASINVAENSAAVTTVVAGDADLPAQSLGYSIIGGADAARFTINTTTGELSFVAAPDYEAPTDGGANNVYEVTVQVSDGALTNTQAIAVTITDVGGPLTVTTTADLVDGDTSSVEALLADRGADGYISLREAISAANNTAGTDTIALPAGTYTISLPGFDDQNLGGDFDIRQSLIINGAGADRTVISAGGVAAGLEVVAGNVSISDLTIRDGYTFSSGAGIEVNTGASLMLNRVIVRDNTSFGGNGGGISSRGTLMLTDVEIRDNSAFNLGGGIYQSGASLALERVTLAGNSALRGGGLYAGASAQSLTNVTVSGNSASSQGGGIYLQADAALQNITIAGNSAVQGGGLQTRDATLSVTLRNVLLADNTGGNVGKDDGTAGVTSLGHNLSTSNTLDLDQATDLKAIAATLDALADNGGFTRTHALRDGSLAIDSGDVVSAPTADQRGAARVGAVDIGSYESRVAANQAPVNTVPVALTALEDMSAALSGISVSDPDNAGSIALYRLAETTLSVSSGSLRVTLAGTASFSAGANNSATLTLSGSQADLNATLASLSYRGNTDFNGSDTLVVTSRDGAGLSDTDALVITVSAVNDAPGGRDATIIISPDANHTLARASFGFADASGDSDRLAAVLVQAPSAGLLRLAGLLITVPTEVTVAQLDAGQLVYSTPAGAKAGAYAKIVFQVRDDGGTAGGGVDLDAAQRLLTVVVSNQAPAIISDGGGATASVGVLENGTNVTTVAAGDANGDALTYRIVGGVDAALFAIDGTTGVLSFIAPPNHEAPSDADADNRYDVTVQVSDGTFVDSQALAVMITNVNEAPVIVANSLAIAEGDSAAPTVRAGDADSAPAQLLYTVSGLTGGRFELTSAAGVAISSFTQAQVDAGLLRFVHDGGQAAPSYLLALSDGALNTAAQAASITFTSTNDAPTAPSIDLGSIDEDGSRLISAAELLRGAVDADGDALSVSDVAVASGQGSLADLGNGSWVYAPAADWSGAVTLTYLVGDGSVQVPGRALLTVAPVNDAPQITSLGGAASATLTIDENGSAVTRVTASDIDSAAPLRYSIGGGADAGIFTIDADSGALRFAVAPDRERPADVDADNRYDVRVRVSDGARETDQALTVAVANVDEAPTLVTNSITVHNDGRGATVVLLATDPDTPASALIYQVSGETGGRFERVDTPGNALGTFTQADVNAGAVRFVVDGSGATPQYGLQLSDGSSRFAAAAVTVQVDVPPPDVVGAPTDVAAALAPAAAALPVAGEVAPAADRLASPAAAVSAEPEANRAAAAPAVSVADEFVRSDVAGAAFEAAASRAIPTAPGEARGAARSQAAAVEAVAWQPDANVTGETNATEFAAAVEIGTGLPALDLNSALRERSLVDALAPLRRDAEAASGGHEQLVVGGSALSASLSVGYVLWLARGGVLMASVLSALPAWATLDPLPVLGELKGRRPGPAGAVAGDEDEEDDQDAVEQLFSKAPAGTPPAATATADASTGVTR